MRLILRKKELNDSLHSRWSASTGKNLLCTALELAMRTLPLEVKLKVTRRSLPSRTVRSSSSRGVRPASSVLSPRPFPHIHLLVRCCWPAAQDLPHSLCCLVFVADQLHRLLLARDRPPRGLVCQHPHVAGALLRLGPLAEVGVHAQVVSHAVLPPVVLGLEVGVVLADPLVDPRHCQCLLVFERQCDQVSVGGVGLGTGYYASLCCRGWVLHCYFVVLGRVGLADW